MHPLEGSKGSREQCLLQYRVDYAEKRKAENRERVRRCRTRQASLRESESPHLAVAIESAPVRHQDACDRSVVRTSSKLATKLANIVSNRLRRYDPVVQHLTIEKFLGHGMLTGMLPDFLVDPTQVKLRHSVLGNLKEGMIDHLTAVRESKIVMAKDIVCTLAASSNMGSNRRVADLIGVDRRNLRRGMERRLLLDTQQNAFWLSHDSINLSVRCLA